MNDLALRPAGGAVSIPDRAPVPRVSGSLSGEVARILDPNDESHGRYATDRDRTEAAAAVLEFEALLAPVERRQFGAWLGAINASCRKPLDEADFVARLASIGADCRHLPAACFTVETRRDLHALTPWFPGAGDILAVCDPVARSWRRKLAALRRIAEGSAVPQRKGSPSAMGLPDVPHVEAQVRALREQVGASDARVAREPRGAVARPLRPAQLIAAYEQQVAEGHDPSGAAAFRLALLRRQFGEGP